MAMEFLRIQNDASEANGAVVNGSTSLEFCPGKHLAKQRFVQDLSRIRPQMMQKVLSSLGLPEDKKTDLAPVNRQAEGFNGQSEAPSQLMELFPVSTGFGSNPRVTETNITLPFATGQTDADPSRSVVAKAPQQPSTDQLTIFYNGAMIVCDVPPEKAQAIMKLASASSSSNTRTSTITSSKVEQISKPLPFNSPSNGVKENQPRRPPVGLEIVRKLSLQRFLEKRKERINSVAPYTTMEMAALPSKVMNESEDQIFLSLAR